MPQDIMVIIATSGQRPDLLQRTLQSLGKAAKPDNYARTIVVENGGGPARAVEETVKAFGPSLGAVYLTFPEGNKSKALNYVLEQYPDGLMVFTDDDVVVPEHWLTAYAEAAAPYDGGRFFGGPLEPEYAESVPLPWVRQYLPPSASGWRWTGGAEVNKPDFLGANWAAFASDLRSAGGFDAARGPGGSNKATGQEMGMQEALLNRGIKGVYVPEALVWHYVPAERCSAQWCIDRSRRNGIATGRMLAGQWSNRSGYPPMIWYLWRRHLARKFIALVSFSSVWRFKVRRGRAHLDGVMEGFDAERRDSQAVGRASDSPR